MRRRSASSCSLRSGACGRLPLALDPRGLDVAVHRGRDVDAAHAHIFQALFERRRGVGAAADRTSSSTPRCSPPRRRPSASRSAPSLGFGLGCCSRTCGSCSAAFCPTSSPRRPCRSSSSRRWSSSGLGCRAVPAWVAVAVIAAYLTFFPVTINTIRGLLSADRRALELMRSYAAGSWRSSGSCAFPQRCRTSSPR